ncbi:MAG: MobF family relaxase, partial [Candidatus Dormibacteria bacterium]
VWGGTNPATGEEVRHGANGEHVPGIDLTLSPPKSWSGLWAVADPQMQALMEEAFDRARNAAIAHVQREVPLVRRRAEEGGPPIHEPAAAIVASVFRHHTSRVTAEAAAAGVGADPQMHDHIVIANMARRSDGMLVAVDSHALMCQTLEVDGIFLTALANEARDLGFQVVPEAYAWEIKGFSRAKIDFWSKREHEVLGALKDFEARHGRRATDEERRNLVTLSRGGKDVNAAGDFERWRREEKEQTALANERSAVARFEAEHGRPPTEAERQELREQPLLGPGEMQATEVLDVAGGQRAEAERQGVRPSELLLLQDRPRTPEEIARAVVGELTKPQLNRLGREGSDRLTESSAVFDELQLRKLVAHEMRQHQVDPAHYAEILEHVHQAPELVPIPGGRHWTTTRHLETEKFVLDAAATRHRTGGSRIPPRARGAGDR